MNTLPRELMEDFIGLTPEMFNELEECFHCEDQDDDDN